MKPISRISLLKVFIIIVSLLSCKKEKSMNVSNLNLLKIDEKNEYFSTKTKVYYDETKTMRIVEKYEKNDVNIIYILPHGYEIHLNYYYQKERNKVTDAELSLRNTTNGDAYSILSFSTYKEDIKFVDHLNKTVRVEDKNGNILILYKRHYMFTEFYRNGSVKRSGKLTYKDIKCGYWYYYSPEGKIIREILYDCNGWIKKDKIYDESAIYKYFHDREFFPILDRVYFFEI